MTTTQKFGGNWTEEKLDIFTRYLNAYLCALRDQKFKKIYVDAFAGTGEIETSGGEQYLDGSAKRALAADKQFDWYFFIENDKEKAAELQNMINVEFPHLARIVTIYCGDANEKLTQIIDVINWRNSRGLLFLDPYATEVNWTTLENVAKTESIDVWYLFPFSALNRMLPKNGQYEAWENCINRLLVDSGWRNEFYKEDPQMSLFDSFPDIGISDFSCIVVYGAFIHSHIHRFRRYVWCQVFNLYNEPRKSEKRYFVFMILKIILLGLAQQFNIVDESQRDQILELGLLYSIRVDITDFSIQIFFSKGKIYIQTDVLDYYGFCANGIVYHVQARKYSLTR